MRIGFIGAGSMATALARGLGQPALVFDPDSDRAQRLASDLEGEVATSNADLAARSDLVVLGHKPHHLDAVADELGGRAPAIASIVAATPIERIEATFPEVPVIRLMPNIPVEVGRGVIAWAEGAHAAKGPRDELRAQLERAGTVIDLDEAEFEPAMAVMSCGPAFMAEVVSSLADAGARQGLDARRATQMVVATMGGSAAYLEHNGYEPAELRGRVATPGGHTERGLGVLEEQGAQRALRAAVDFIVEGTR